eukprot:TRINITY_DN4722_c0_g1_i1.p1 TRINITY_DN4722_c0_g1~~TRINITY_DN4722_c0_g1_i1.p1  ORF type:complete len:695 (+),score=157.69 TRINITY_DN4722_c0_g1_i1:65-2149(+)
MCIRDRYKQGTQVYIRKESPHQISIKKAVLFEFLFVLAVCVSLYAIIEEFYARLVAPTLVGAFILSKFLSFNKKSRKIEMLGKIIIEDSPFDVYDRLRLIKNRPRWDWSLKSLHEVNPDNDKADSLQTMYDVVFKLYDCPRSLGKTKEIPCKMYRKTCEFFKNYIITEISEHDEGEGKKFKGRFRLNEAIIICQYPRLAGKSLVYYYTKVDTTKISLASQEKFKVSRVLNLAIAKDFLMHERHNQIATDIQDEENIEKMTKDIPTGGKKTKELEIKIAKESFSKRQSGIVSPVPLQSHQKTYQKLFNAEEMAEEVYHFSKGRDQVQRMLRMVDALIAGQLTNYPGKPLEQRKPGYKRATDGGIECYNKDELKTQEGLILELMKTVGKTLIEGKNVVSISLPVRIFEPRSTLERLCDGWAFAPIYLTRAAQSDSPLERMKNVAAFAISGLYNQCKQLKPFNPILGETYQAYWPDGSEVFIEHTSHHPPVSNFMMIDFNKRWKMTGYYEYKGALRGNSIVGRQEGPNVVTFNDGSSIKFNCPNVRLSGFLYGDRIIQPFGDISFEDKKNDICLKLTFYEGSGFFSQNLHPSDYFEGNITKISAPDEILSRAKGSFVEYIEFDGKRYWDLEKIDPMVDIKTNDPLPSDCRFREDLIYLAKRDLVKAQEHKIRLEVIQRADRKLRHEYAERRGAKSPH